MWRYRVLRTSLGAAAYCSFAHCNVVSDSDNKAKSQRKKHDGQLSEALAKIRANEDEMRLRWIRDEDHWRKLPSRSWPDYQPTLDEVPILRGKIAESCKDRLSKVCHESKFNLATALTFNQVDGLEGLDLYKEIGEQGYSDGMTAIGVCLLEGIPHFIDYDVPTGVDWLKKAVEAKNAQGLYEMGILFYTGSAEPVIKEDEYEAFKYFKRAAALNHTSGLYMIAMMMMKEQGSVSDLPQSIDLLYRAGERGHRTARATLLKILDEYE